MRLTDIIKRANHNLWRNRSRTILTTLAITVGSLTIMLTVGINAGVNGYIDKQVESTGGNDIIEVMPKGIADRMSSMMTLGATEVQEYRSNQGQSQQVSLTDRDLAGIKRLKGVKLAKLSDLLYPSYITRDRDEAKKYKLTVGPLAASSIKLDLAAGRSVRIDGSEAEAILPDRYLEPLGFSSAKQAIGQMVRVGVPHRLGGQIDEVKIRIVGVQNQSIVGFGRVFLNDAAGRLISSAYLTGMPEALQSQHGLIIIQVKPGYESKEKLTQIKQELTNMGYSSISEDDYISSIKLFFNAITVILTIFGVIALITASIGIVNTLLMSVQERTREIGLMKAMGLSSGRIFALFSLEAVSLGFWGGMLAAGLAVVIKQTVNPWAGRNFLSGLPGFNLIELNPLYVGAIVVIVMVVAFLAGTLPAKRATKQDPIQALRYE
ncbi:ABC transporter permease [Candidatus Saccharibacteria bacterium]|nr:ABC transporter permease [Candidatus Saccharibacteria bacterium]